MNEVIIFKNFSSFLALSLCVILVLLTLILKWTFYWISFYWWFACTQFRFTQFSNCVLECWVIVCILIYLIEFIYHIWSVKGGGLISFLFVKFSFLKYNEVEISTLLIFQFLSRRFFLLLTLLQTVSTSLFVLWITFIQITLFTMRTLFFYSLLNRFFSFTIVCDFGNFCIHIISQLTTQSIWFIFRYSILLWFLIVCSPFSSLLSHLQVLVIFLCFLFDLSVLLCYDR